MENFEKEIEEIISCVSESEPLLALDRALILAKSCDETTFGNLIHLKGRYQFLEKNRRDGTLQFSEQSSEYSALNRSLLGYVSELKGILKKRQAQSEVLSIKILSQPKPEIQLKRHAGEITDRLQELMYALDLRPTQFARQLGIRQPAISQILTGHASLSLNIVKRLATRYPELNLRWFLIGEGMMFLKCDERQLVIEKNT